MPYYTIALSRIFMKDDDSRNMLDIIYKNVSCDPTYNNYIYFGFTYALSIGYHENYMSWYDSNLEIINQLIDDLTDALDE